MNKIRHFILSRPRAALLILAAVYAIATALYPVFNKPLDSVETTPSLHSAIDERIVFSPVWIIPYVIWYFFLPSVALALMFKDQKQCGVTLLTMTLGVLLCYLTYSLFQTQVPRPDVPGADLFSRLVRLIYSIDQPYNAFPSIHVLITYALMLGAAKARGIKKATKAAIWVVGWSIILSTVFVKQHVAADILGGLVLAQFLHWLLAGFLSRWLFPDKKTEAISA